MIREPAGVGRYALALLWITVKRIAKNWRLVTPLLLGLILASAFVAAVPIYSAASLQRSFIERWREQDSFRAPFAVIPSHRNPRRKLAVPPERLAALEQYLQDALQAAAGQPAQSFSSYRTFGVDLLALPLDAGRTARVARAELGAMSNLQEHAEVIDGRWFRDRDDGVVEVVVGGRTLDELELLVGSRYRWAYTLRADEEIDAAAAAAAGIDLRTVQGQRFAAVTVEVVGLVRPQPGLTSREWIYPLLPDRLFMRSEPFARMQQAGLRVDRADWQWVFDDRRVQVADVGRLITQLEAIEARMAELAPGTEFWLSPLEFFGRFRLILDRVSLFLLSLAAPTLAMIVAYVMLMAALSVEQRIAEVATLHSRGAGRLQVLASFALEWAVLAGAAALVGPYVGLIAARSVGSAEGFLGFAAIAGSDAAPPLPLSVTRQSRWFAALASFLTVAAAVGPAAAGGRLSVVTLRQLRARGMRRSFWHRYFIDVIVLGIGFYGYSSLRWQSVRLAPDATIDADPLLFVVPVLFFLGFGLALLRVFPLAMGALSRLTASMRGVVWQLSFRRLARNTGPFVSVVVLLIVTVAMGIYNGSAARTLQRNIADRIRYQVGAELVVIESWVPPNPDEPLPPRRRGDPRPVAASEPPWLARAGIAGVEAMARVLYRRVEGRRGTEQIGAFNLLAVTPGGFARAAWRRDDLLPYPIIDYLAALARHREGVLISTALAARHGIGPGDAFTITYQNQPIEVYVLAVIPYWPALDPFERAFAVANLAHVQDYTVLEPYESWYSLRPEAAAAAGGVTGAERLVAELAELGVHAERVLDTGRQLAELQREPYRRGFFGVLSLGFAAAAVVTVLALIVSTISSTREQSVQLAALRANGLSAFQTTGVLAVERILTVGVGVGLGVAASRLAALLFLPLLRDRAAEVAMAPPYLVVTDVSDLTTLLVTVAAALAAAVVAVAMFISRRQVAGAVRLGDEP